MDGSHARENVSFVVFEAGVHELADGTRIEVGSTATGKVLEQGMDSVAFSSTFGAAPSIFTQVQTENEAGYLLTRQANGSKNGFSLALQEHEGAGVGHTSETVGWFAIDRGTADAGGLTLVSGSTGSVVTDLGTDIGYQNHGGNPFFFASLASAEGGDSASVRLTDAAGGRGATVYVEEDTANDSETWHTSEEVNWLAVFGDGLLEGTTLQSGRADAPTLDFGGPGGVSKDGAVDPLHALGDELFGGDLQEGGWPESAWAEQAFGSDIDAPLGDFTLIAGTQLIDLPPDLAVIL